MAIYRQLHTTFWKDDFIGNCSQKEKLFFLYLISNDNTTQSGVYEFNKRYAIFELGVSQSEIEEMINKFHKYKKIIYDRETNEILIVNWLKYNNANSPKVSTVIDKELRDIKSIEFKKVIIKKCSEYKYPIRTKIENIGNPSKKSEQKSLDTVSIPYQYPIDIVPIEYPYSTDTDPQQNRTEQNSNTIQQNRTATEQKTDAVNQADTDTDSKLTPYKFFQECFGTLNSVNSEDITYWISDLGEDLVCEAMKRAALDNKSYSYAKGIMKKWAKNNITTMEQVLAEDVKFENNRVKSYNSNPSPRKETLPEWATAEQAEETPLTAEEEEYFKERMKKLNKG